MYPLLEPNAPALGPLSSAPYHAVVVETQARAKVCQAYVAIHVKQDVVRLDIPGRWEGEGLNVCAYV